MLIHVNELKNLRLSALDGEIGRVVDCYFDDESWTVRYLVVKAGGWFSGRHVLISPAAVADVLPEPGILPVRLTMAQVESSPPIDTDVPVSRQKEVELNAHYSWPYWGLTAPPGEAALAGAAATDIAERREAAAKVRERSDPKLRSADHVAGYTIDALDGAIGQVADFLIDSEDWAVRYMVVDTRNWLPGKKVLLAPAWIRIIDWSRREVVVDVTSEAIRSAPAYEGPGAVGREYESALHRHYSKTAYWLRAEGSSPGGT